MRSVERTLQAILVLKEVEDLAEDSSRDHRGYRLFGDSRDLDTYRRAT